MTQYACAVLDGEVIAGRWVRLACERHLADLRRKDIVWKAERAVWVINFFPDVLRLAGGEFEGVPFELLWWQKFIVGSLFGWQLPDGRRRYNIAYVEVAKGSGKSPLAGGIGHYGMTADGEARAEIYAAAVKKDQAMILFRDAVAMRDQSPCLARRLIKSGKGEKCWNLADHITGSWYRPISSEEDSQSGPRPHFALVDEVHEHKSSVVIDMLQAGFKWRRNPLMFMITNSGFDRETVCWRYHEYVTKILKGTMRNDRFFGFIACLDPCNKHWKEGQEQPVDNCKRCDDWATEGPHWQKANPSLDRIPGREYLRAQVQKALDMPAEQNTVRRLNFGYWTNQATRWISMELWDSCGGAIDLDALRGQSCYIGVDLSIDKDLTAVVLLFTPPIVPTEEKEETEKENQSSITFVTIDVQNLEGEFTILPFLFMPRSVLTQAERRDNVPYSQWERDGHLFTTEGDVIDYAAVRQKIVELQDSYPVMTHVDDKSHQTYHLIGYDPFNAQDFANVMQRDFGVNMIKVYQNHGSLNEPTKQLTRLIKAKKLRHGGHPILRWMADNVAVSEDRKSNQMPDRQKSKSHIDGISALVNAFALAIRIPVPAGSVYETRGVLAV